MKSLRIGTRGSALALWQARSVGEALRRGGVESELVIVKTSGDKSQHAGAGELGGTGVFIKELEDALLERTVDLAVHSMKDVPTEIPVGLVIAAMPKREDARDALISAGGASFSQLVPGARVGTSSLRRQAQLLHARSDLRMLPIRGNVDTRLEKLGRGDYDAIVLAKAGLDRLGLAGRITEVLATGICVPAAGQGAIGIETRADDRQTVSAVSGLNHAETATAVRAERAALGQLQGGCQASIGAWARVVEGKLLLDVAVLSPDGAERLSETVSGAADDPVALGREAAGRLLARGAQALLARQGREKSA